MICKNCGCENPDEFTFCQNCGKRLDGKRICPSCGEKIDEEAKFCGFCGANLEIVNSETAATQAVAAKESKIPDNTKVKNIIDLSGLVLVLFAAFVGLLFTFFIGVTAAGVTRANIYQYFGKAYEQYKDVVIDESNIFQVTISIIPDIFGTVVSAAAIIGTLILAILTSVEVYKKYAQKQENTKIVKYATQTYIWFAAAATLFLALHAVSSEVSNVLAQVKFNGATLAGLILGGIAIGGYYCCKIVNNLREYKNSKCLISSVIAMVVAVLAIVVTAYVASPVIKVAISQTPQYEYTMGYFIISLPLSRYCSETAEYIKIIASCVSGYLSQIIIVIMAIIVLVKAANAVCGEGKGNKLPIFAAICFVFAIANLVCAVMLGNMYKEVDSGYVLGYGMPIAVIVISAIALAGSISYKVLSAEQK